MLAGHITHQRRPPPEWWIDDAPVPYEAAVVRMEAHVEAMLAGAAGEAVWLLEHPALYTAGTSAKPEDLLDAGGLPVYRTGRGGRFTYHGPGQRVAYVMRDLRCKGRDLRAFVCGLEEWVIETLARFNVKAERRAGRIGVWVEHRGRECKIAAVGVRVRRWVTYHGMALNVDPELRHFAGIVPCGIREHGVTSLVELGLPVTMSEVDAELRATYEALFADD